eukprot:scaffold42782_cov144-Skeletonema_dohrnii-CCMP3373.AAC.1
METPIYVANAYPTMPQKVPAKAKPFHSVLFKVILLSVDIIFATKAAAVAGPQMAVFDAITTSSTLSGNDSNRGNNFINARDPVVITMKCTNSGTEEKMTLEALDQPLSTARHLRSIDVPITDMRIK